MSKEKIGGFAQDARVFGLQIENSEGEEGFGGGGKSLRCVDRGDANVSSPEGTTSKKARRGHRE